ncbi:MAG: DNA recombination protein RmuC [Actinomycetaceae bacterium]|nr:DNA recombination protein RmuC [Actinomycetaceae bacterium]
MTSFAWIMSAFTLCLGIILGSVATVWWHRHTADNAPTATPTTDTAVQIARDLAPLTQGVTQLNARLTQLENHHSAGVATLREQLRQTQLTDRLILEATQGLDNALRQAPKRGTWGEASLQRVLEASGLSQHIDFSLQMQHNAGASRPDAVIHLPTDAHLVIDAKVPLDAYLQAHENDEEAYALMQEHARAVRAHMRQLARRDYAKVVAGAVDTVVMYLPSEALLSASFDADPALFEDALKTGIVIVGPAGLMTLLRSVGSLWARQHLDEDAQTIVELGRTMVERMEVLARHLAKLGANLTTTVDTYNAAVGSFEQRLAASTRAVTALATRTPDPLPPVDVRTRSLQMGQASADD